MKNINRYGTLIIAQDKGFKFIPDYKDYIDCGLN